MFLPVAILLIIFCYIPIYGIVVAFQNYAPGSPFVGPNVKWVGLKHFTTFFQSIYFSRLIGNTLVLSILNLIFGFWIPIIFALLLNEVRHVRFKKFAQTASYLPHFISMVVVAGILINFTTSDGLVNNIIARFNSNYSPQNLRLNASAFPTIYTVTNVWKGFGWGSILYLSTISSIDPGMYEAARIDGGNRWHQAWYITLPGLKNIIAIRLIMSVGAILAANSELILLIYSPATYETADVIGTYVYRVGLLQGQFSYTTAIGFFMAVIGFALTYITNMISNRITGYGLW